MIEKITGLRSNLQSHLHMIKILNLTNLCMSLSRRRMVIYFSATPYDRVMARSNETFIRAILEQVKFVAIILHGHCNQGTHNTIFEIDFKPAAEVHQEVHESS